MELDRSKKALYLSIKTSSVIEGIRHPFAKGKDTYWPETMDDLIRHWKQRVASARSPARRAPRAARTRGSSPRE